MEAKKYPCQIINLMREKERLGAFQLRLSRLIIGQRYPTLDLKAFNRVVWAKRQYRPNRHVSFLVQLSAGIKENVEADASISITHNTSTNIV